MSVRCFIGQNHALVQHRFTECLDLRLGLRPICPTHWVKIEPVITGQALPKIFSRRHSEK
jgi:hypothetical protein